MHQRNEQTKSEILKDQTSSNQPKLNQEPKKSQVGI